MLDINVLNQSNLKQDENDYYNYRKTLHSIYDKDVYYGDLVGSILAFRDKNKYIESVSVDIADYKIYMSLSDSTKENEKNKILKSIDSTIKDFINLASTQLSSDTDKKLIDKYIDSKWPICDKYIMDGETLQIEL